jgi:hypothetical protein
MAEAERDFIYFAKNTVGRFSTTAKKNATKIITKAGKAQRTANTAATIASGTNQKRRIVLVEILMCFLGVLSIYTL